MNNPNSSRARNLESKPSAVRRWTQEEYDLLEEHYETHGLEYVSEQLGRSENAVYNRAHALGLKPPKKQRQTPWPKSDDDILRAHYRYSNARAIGEILERSEEFVKDRARYLGLRKNEKKRATAADGPGDDRAEARRKLPTRGGTTWSKEEYDFIQEHYEARGAEYVSEQLRRSKNAVHTHAKLLGLTSKRYWSKEEDDVLRKHYNSITARELGEKLGRSARAVNARARHLGISKSAWH